MTAIKIARAFLSVSDKTGLTELGAALARHNVELISTGGTADALRKTGLTVRDVSEVTGFPEMMDGRVKTLHPRVHGGLLAVRSNSNHVASMDEHDIPAIDLLVVNLYPFEETVARGADFDETVENIDIGGPALIRAAAKNHESVAVIVDPSDYDGLIEMLSSEGGTTSLEARKAWAAKAYARTGAYDAAIANWFQAQLNDEIPDYWVAGGRRGDLLRYGENPHQQAAFYRNGDLRPGIASAEQRQGKELSYNNLNDTDAAIELIGEFPPTEGPAVAIIKHANPCGAAQAKTLLEAYEAALRCDPVSAFGGIVALNQRLDVATAEALSKIFTEVIAAPDADDAALEILASKKNLRVLLTGGLPDARAPGRSVRSVAGGFLVQSRDAGSIDRDSLKVVTKRAPTESELDDLVFAFKVAKHVKSNAIVYAKNGATVGVGAGQMSRLDSSRIAARKSVDAAEAAGETKSLAMGSVVASDAFFPFADGLLAAAEAGATAIIQPGGSIRDDEVIAAADEAGLAMVFTGIRHFRH